MIHILLASGILCLPVFCLQETKCKIWEKFQLNSLYKKGDIILGGTFILNFKTIPPDLSFTSKPDNWECDGFEISVFQRAQAMIFAIEEINKNQTFLPNITLGYRLYDDCNNVQVGLRATIALTGGLEDDITDYNCKEYPPVLAIVGDPLSSHSIATSRILSVFQIPMVSFSATCSCLSNKQDYPTFFRTIPSDRFQVNAIVQIIKHYRWTWIGAIATDDDYGQNALKDFIKEIQTIACIEFTETILIVNEKVTFPKIISTIKKSSAKVIVVFSPEEELSALVKEVVQQNITGRQWIASESWSTSAVLAVKENFVSFGGTIGIAIRKGEIPGFKEFLQQSNPNLNSQSNLMVEFWESLFQCKFMNATIQNNFSSKVCTGSEDIKTTKTAYNDVTDLRLPYTVYKAVYAIAHSLHDLMACKTGEGPFLNNSCANIRNVQPWQLLYYLKKVNFVNHLGERVTFDENGDPSAIYDIVNWQLSNDESVDFKIVGLFDESQSGKELSLNEKDIFWNFATGRVPESVCSKSCLPGTRKATRKGEPICCFDCIPCADGEISSQNDSTECFKCPPDYWSNLERSECIQKEIEFLSYDDAMGITLTATSALGACLSLSVLAIFIHHRHTPVVKANNSELSFLLLVSLTLCFLCVLCFIGKPSEITCTIRHVVFGLSFAVCISCILVKTIVVIMAFKATLPGNNMVKWFGTSQQRGTVFFTAFIQSIICLIWLTTAPPLPNKNTKYQNSKIIFECHVGSLIGFSCLLGYIGLLACICFLLAFLARNLPDTFNEAKFITFSMLIFCAVWITFVPAYISSPGKHTVAVEIFAILASSFGLLFSIFAPKCYIILLRPELNTKKALMGRTGQNK